LNEKIKNKESEYTQKSAKIEFNKGDYPLAKKILKFLWNNAKKDNLYLLYHYG